LEINKFETAELTYKLAITYLGQKNNKSAWKVEINDRIPTHTKEGRTGKLGYFGSHKIETKAFDMKTIEIQETEPAKTGVIYVDLSDKSYPTSRTQPVQDRQIQQLVDKAKVFAPSDIEKVKKVMYHRSVGVIIYTGNDNIYFAKPEDDDFTMTDATMRSICKCPNNDSEWEVKLKNEQTSHKLTFALESDSEEECEPTSWDALHLNKIKL
jgi:hypothetical protein